MTTSSANPDILFLIAEFIEPNPYTCCRLSEVNRTFYCVFTSDRVWRRLDPYGVRSGIYSHFISSDRKQLDSLRMYWDDPACRETRILSWREPPPLRDLYCWLGYISHYNRDGWATRVGTIRALILCAVHIDGGALEYASAALRDDEEVVVAAVSTAPKKRPFPHRKSPALFHASPRLQSLDRVVRASVSRDGRSLKWAHSQFKRSKEFVMLAVENHGMALGEAALELREDLSVVEAAVHRDGLALQFAGKELRDTKEIVLEAVRSNGKALEFASARLRNNIPVVTAAVKQNGVALEFASLRLKDSHAILRLSEAHISPYYRWTALRFASPRLKNNYAFGVLVLMSSLCGRYENAALRSLLGSDDDRLDEKESRYLRSLVGLQDDGFRFDWPA